MKQGDIWLVSLDATIGAEIRKTRPAIIVNDNSLGKLPLKIIVPVTDWKDRYSVAPWMVKLIADRQNDLIKDSSADCFQVRSVAEERCVKHLGLVNNDAMDKIRKAVALILTIEAANR